MAHEEAGAAAPRAAGAKDVAEPDQQQLPQQQPLKAPEGSSPMAPQNDVEVEEAPEEAEEAATASLEVEPRAPAKDLPKRKVGRKKAAARAARAAAQAVQAGRVARCQTVESAKAARRRAQLRKAKRAAVKQAATAAKQATQALFSATAAVKDAEARAA